MEHNNLVNAIDELGSEALFLQTLTYGALDSTLIHAIILLQPEMSHVTGHNNHGIFEIDRASLSVSKPPVIQEL